MNTSSLLVIATASTSLLVGVGVGYLAGRQSGREAALAEIAAAPPIAPTSPAEPTPATPEPTRSTAQSPTPRRPSPAETPSVVVSREDEGSDAAENRPRTHKVQAGDVLSKLAVRYKVTVPDIKKANNLRSDNIRVGQVLTIPLPGEKSTDTESSSTEDPTAVATPATTPGVVVAPGPSNPSPVRVTITPPGAITEAAPIPPVPESAPAPVPSPSPVILEPATIAAPEPPTVPAASAPAPIPPAITPTAPPAPGPDTLALADTTPAAPPSTTKPVAKVGTIPQEHQQMFTNTAGVGMRWEASSRTWRSMREMRDEAEAVAKATEWNDLVPTSPHELSAIAAGYHYEASGTRVLLLPPGGAAPPAELPAQPAPAPQDSPPPSASIPNTGKTLVSVPSSTANPRPMSEPPAPRANVPLPKAMEKNFVIQRQFVGVTMAWDKEKRAWNSKDENRLRGLAFMLARTLNDLGSHSAGDAGEIEKAARAAGYLYEADGPNRLLLSARP